MYPVSSAYVGFGDDSLNSCARPGSPVFAGVDGDASGITLVRVVNYIMGEDATTFGDLEPFDRVRITTDEGATIEGPVSPIDYVPEESLRAEVGPDDEGNVRYEFRATYEDGEWTPVSARRIEIEQGEWESIGEVETVESVK